jgi:glycosyltransferase involved in cell wall biosynthesis
MKILYLAQWFATPDQPGLSRAYELGRGWARLGHQVRIVSGAVDHLTLSEVTERPPPFRIHALDIDGIRVERVWSTNGGGRGKWQRASLFGSYALCALWAGARGPVPDLVIASSPPTSVGLVGLCLARRYAVPLVYELRDLWPDFLLASGVLARGPEARILRALEHVCRRRAHGLVAVTQGGKAALESLGIESDRIAVVPHGVDHFMYDPVQRRDGPAARFSAVFAGNESRFHALDDLIAASAIVDRHLSFQLTLLGDGDERRRLEASVKASGLDCVRFVPVLSRRDTFHALVNADVCLLAARPEPHFDHWLPNKVFDYLASGTPIVAGARGELARLIHDSRAGTVVEPGRPELLAGAIMELAQRPPEERRRIGALGRAHALGHFGRAHRAEALLPWLEELRARSCASR